MPPEFSIKNCLPSFVRQGNDETHLITELRDEFGRSGGYTYAKDSAGYIRTSYTYTPFGTVTANGDVTHPIQWSSEFNDEELGLVYYNYRHYNSKNGRWISRDFIQSYNLFNFVLKTPLLSIDCLGLQGIFDIDNNKCTASLNIKYFIRRTDRRKKQ